MGRIKINCCLNCEDRHVGCHSSCDRYKQERAEIDAAKAAASAQSRADADEVLREGCRKYMRHRKWK